MVEAYAREQGLWRELGSAPPGFTDTLTLDLSTVEPSLAGPKRPQDRVALAAVATSFAEAEAEMGGGGRSAAMDGARLEDGAVVIAAITSCTNTSNPAVMVAAGLLARNAVAKGLQVKPWVKTSLAPGSQVVSDYLRHAGLQDDLDALGFDVVGYGCTTCIGNSGPLPPAVAQAVDAGDLIVSSVLSGNRNFEGRVHAQVRANYLASPPLVVAYALAGSVKVDLTRDPLAEGSDGKPVHLAEIWPSQSEIAATLRAHLSPEMFRTRYADVFDGTDEWRAVDAAGGEIFDWQDASTYVRHPTFFDSMSAQPGAAEEVLGARALAMLGDSITTDHISPAGAIQAESPAGAYLITHGVTRADFNSYGARRGNHEVMVRGTFANIRIRNELAPGIEGGFTRHQPSGATISIYDAAMRYRDEGVPLIVVAGREYGTGSSRDWAAKGTKLLGIKAVVAESFERIHRSNLVGMGVLPLQFKDGTTRMTLGLTGEEMFDIVGFAAGITPRMDVTMRVHGGGGAASEVPLTCRIDTQDEVDYFRHGGILQYVLRGLAKAA